MFQIKGFCVEIYLNIKHIIYENLSIDISTY